MRLPLLTILILWFIIVVQAIQLGNWIMLVPAAVGVFAAVMDLRKLP